LSPHQSAKISNLIGEWLATNNHPLSTVEEKEFKILLAALEPRYEVISRTTIRNNVIPNIYGKVRSNLSDSYFFQMKLEVINSLKLCSSFALTADIWTSPAMKGYLAITLHAIGENFTLLDYLLQVRELPGSHTGDVIAAAIDCCLQEFELSNHHSFLVSDGASNMKSSAHVAKMNYVWCAAHLINLVVRDVLQNVSSIRDMIDEFKQVWNVFVILNACRLSLMSTSLLLPLLDSVQYK
jgi:hypothetical protein